MVGVPNLRKTDAATTRSRSFNGADHDKTVIYAAQDDNFKAYSNCGFALIQQERPKHLARCADDILMAVKHVGLRGVGHLPDASMP
jgi:hypothetical protein